jgi:citrate synthase
MLPDIIALVSVKTNGTAADDSQNPGASTNNIPPEAVALPARFPTIGAAYRRLRQGLEPLPPRPDMGHAANTFTCFRESNRSSIFPWRAAGTRPSLSQPRSL